MRGYAGVVGDALPVGGSYSPRQTECMKILKEGLPSYQGDAGAGQGWQGDRTPPARAYFEQHGFSKYLVCPFVHTIGLHEAESPFFGPNSLDVLKPGMTVCVDVSFFGHPEFHGVRIETGYQITEKGAVPFSPKMDALLCKD